MRQQCQIMPHIWDVKSQAAAKVGIFKIIFGLFLKAVTESGYFSGLQAEKKNRAKIAEIEVRNFDLNDQAYHQGTSLCTSQPIQPG